MNDADLERRLAVMLDSEADQVLDINAAWRRLRQARTAALPHRRRRLTAAAAGTAAVLVAAAVLVTGHLRHGPGGAGRTPGRSAGPTSPARQPVTRSFPGAVVARIPVPGAAHARGDLGMAGVVVSAGGELWTIAGTGGRLVRIDPATNHAAADPSVLGAGSLAAGPGGLWATVRSGPAGAGLARINPATGRIASAYPLPASYCRDPAYAEVAYGGGQLWVGCRSRSGLELLRIDPVTGQVLIRGGPVRGGLGDLAATPDGVWFDTESGVSGFVGRGPRPRLVTATGASLPVSLSQAQSLVYAQGAIWVLTSDESVITINPANGKLSRAYTYRTYDPSYSGGLNFLAVGMNSLWFLDTSVGTTSVLRVSIATGLPLGNVPGIGSCGEPCFEIYAADGAIWVPTQRKLARIDPARLPS